MTNTTNGTTKQRKPKPQSLIEQNTMRNVHALLTRSGLTSAGKARVLQYLQMAIQADLEAENAPHWVRPAMEPAPVDPPNQLKVPGTEDPFE